MNNKDRKYNKFLAVTSILTLVIMLIGATFAYFSSVVRAEDPVSVSSVDIRINLNIMPLYNGKLLLPTNDEDINLAYQNQCIDSVGNGACTAYTIEVTNIGDAQEVIGTFKIDNEKFQNLKYMVLDYDTNNIIKDKTSVTTEFSALGDAYSLDKGQTKKFVLIIWISNLEGKQDEEQGLEFTGIVSINSSSGVKLTGTINEELG